MSFPSTWVGVGGLLWARADRASYFHGWRYAAVRALRQGRQGDAAECRRVIAAARKMKRLPHPADLRVGAGEGASA